ncbi:hypothetical protein [Nitrosopumilus sp.]|uniref:hypothetical protein n=1 Tax=Nitrosopumilus sp. TaxID=2024843 RepID=UPI0026120D3F|nr:hypothetical protein [Nitrosopumilus sp.]
MKIEENIEDGSHGTAKYDGASNAFNLRAHGNLILFNLGPHFYKITLDRQTIKKMHDWQWGQDEHRENLEKQKQKCGE